jgi:Molecular chaperone GrpE (heat shock protein)
MSETNQEGLQEELKTILDSDQSSVNSTIEETATSEDVESTNTDQQTDENDHLSKLQTELNELNDRYTRLFAEFDNFKKRTYREKAELQQTAAKEVIVRLLEVLDDAERAEKQMETTTEIEAIKEGTLLVFNKLRHILSQRGLKALDSIGEEFDVEKHEAITEIPATTPDMEGKVVDVLEKGYLLNDKLIRHAKVVVGKSA